MRTLLRRLRGVLGTSLLWAVTWSLGGLALAGFLLLRNPVLRGSEGISDAFLIPVFLFGTWGALGGAIYAIALAMFERRRTLDQLVMARLAVWGALGGMALPLLVLGAALSAYGHAALGPVNSWVIPLALTGMLGAGCATGTLAIARRGAALPESDQRSFPPSAAT
jgi:hypothetical protein